MTPLLPVVCGAETFGLIAVAVLHLPRPVLRRRRIAVFGAGPAFVRVADRLARPGLRRVRMVGRFSDTPEGAEALLALGREGGIDQIVLVLPPSDPARIRRAEFRLRALDVPVARYADLAEADWPEERLDILHDVPVSTLAARPIPAWGRLLKGAADRSVSLLLLACIAPALLAVVLAIRLDSSGPILFRQSREGLNGRRFEILKFRTMAWRPETNGPLRQTERSDPRVTRVGRVLRATSLDELPQLINVLRGDMSLIGPRPHAWHMTTENRLSHEIADDYAWRHRVKPGMTGLAQVNGSRGALASAEDLCRRLRYDLEYIENWSPLLDLRIALLTPLKLIFHSGSAF